jgi:hypothetical protein
MIAFHPASGEPARQRKLQKERLNVIGTEPYQAGARGYLDPMDGIQPRPIPGLLTGESFEWTSDPHFLYVYQRRQASVRIYRLNVISRPRQLFREITPPDVAGLNRHPGTRFSSDGRVYV